MFWSKNKKNIYTPANPSFYMKVGFKGVYIARTCFPDVGLYMSVKAFMFYRCLRVIFISQDDHCLRIVTANVDHILPSFRFSRKKLAYNNNQTAIYFTASDTNVVLKCKELIPKEIIKFIFDNFIKFRTIYCFRKSINRL